MKKESSITHKTANGIKYIVSGSVSVCEQSHQEWERIKRFGKEGGWKLLANAYRQERIWKEWEKKHCH